LLTRQPEKRLGYNGADEIKRHPFFASVDWQKLATRNVKPMFRPNVVRAARPPLLPRAQLATGAR